MFPPLQARLTRLAESFHLLKERLREAVATEMGKVVADAVRDWVTTALHGRWPTPVRTQESPYAPPRTVDAWDDPDPWRDEDPPEEPFEDPIPPVPKVTGWAAALSMGFVAARWLIVRRLPFVPAVGAGALLGAVALVGGPLVQASLAAASAAADLVYLTRSDSRPNP